ncbi:hypothetical protein QR685DRAFT_517875 [Neurospora intermedia]|uniref:Uncharacterized protein n=1 Tax=Neurospora intermedia TaxID=5142 RepID=A0ABR3DMC5_NEUIN
MYQVHSFHFLLPSPFSFFLSFPFCPSYSFFLFPFCHLRGPLSLSLPFVYRLLPHWFCFFFSVSSSLLVDNAISPLYLLVRGRVLNNT